MYFNKQSKWLYDKIDENNAEFSSEEVKQLKGALIDLSYRIRKCAETL